MNIEKFKKVREEQYPITSRWAYFDTATTGLVSKDGKNAMVDYIENRYENAIDMAAFRDNWAFAEEVRNIAAKVINAEPEEIFFGDAASDMLNIFSGGIQIKEGANVVVTNLSFPSTPYNWMNRVGVDQVRIAKSENGQVPPENIFELVDEDTVAIALCLVENTTGFRHDLKTISDFCQEQDIYLVLDVTQCIASMKIDVQETPVDFIATSTYKWLGGLFGIAFGYASKRVLDKINPPYVGWTGIKDKLDQSKFRFDLSEDANKFETGSPNWVGLRGIKPTMELYLDLGKDDVEAYILSMTAYLYEKLDGQAHLGIVGPFAEENRSGISYITFPEEWKLTNDILQEHGIRAHIASKSTMRVAFHYFNNKEDIDKLVDFLVNYK